MSHVSEGTVWRALADPTRRALLDRLRGRPRTTGDLAAGFPQITRYAVMKHLSVLVEAGLVTVERRGRQRLNHLDAVPLRAAYERWMAPYAEQHAVAALRLRDAVQTRQEAEMDTSTVLTGAIDLRTEIDIAAPRAKVWESLLRFGEWWPHRHRADGAVTLEPWPGGRFTETWDGGGALWGTVTRVDAGSLLAVSGAMAMGEPVCGAWTWELADAAGDTRLTSTHRAFGLVGEQHGRDYGDGWGEVLAALKGHVEGRS